MAVHRSVDVADGHRGPNAARGAVQEGAEVADLAVVHHQQLGVGVDGPVPVEVDLFGRLRLVVRHCGKTDFSFPHGFRCLLFLMRAHCLPHHVSIVTQNFDACVELISKNRAILSTPLNDPYTG